MALQGEERTKHQTALLHSVSAIWASPCGGVLFQPIKLRLSESTWRFTAIFLPAFYPPIWVALFWPTRTVPFGPIKLQGLRVLICMRMDQWGTGTGTSVYISQLPWEPANTLSLSTEDYVFLAGIETLKMSCQRRAKQPAKDKADRQREKQTGPEQNRAALPQGCRTMASPQLSCFTALLYDCWAVPQRYCYHRCAVSQLSCFLLYLTPSWGFLLALNWHQLPSADRT